MAAPPTATQECETASPTITRHSEDCRCLCGSLVARIVDGGVELKCRRCRRMLLVPIEAAGPGRGRAGGRELHI
jgi:hypothetical protein